MIAESMQFKLSQGKYINVMDRKVYNKNSVPHPRTYHPFQNPSLSCNKCADTQSKPILILDLSPKHVTTSTIPSISIS
jgi:hypothetical protein